MKLQYLEHTTAKGQLHSITDSAAQHTAGDTYEDASGALYEYGYNGSGSVMVQNRPCVKSYGAGDTNPHWEDIADGDACIALVGIPQSAIPSTYWGWFHTKGPTTNRMYIDAIDHNLTLSPTDGQALSFSSAVCVAGTVDMDDNLDFAVATEARTSSTTVHVWLFGYPTTLTA